MLGSDFGLQLGELYANNLTGGFQIDLLRVFSFIGLSCKMEKNQELEWAEAQQIEIGVDLVIAAKRHLKFLAAVDRNRSLYEGPSLERAIYR